MKAFFFGFACALALALMLVACSGNGGSVQCEEVRFVDAFPKEAELGEASALPLDLMGCVDMFAVDTLAIFKMPEKDYLWGGVLVAQPTARGATPAERPRA